MVNFKKLKALIREYERNTDSEQHNFFKSLKSVAESELRLKQTKLIEVV